MALLSRLAPLEPVQSFDQLNKLMDEFFSSPIETKLTKATFLPAVDVSETDKEYKIKAELPGTKLEDVNVELINNRLTIKGHREFSKEEKNENYLSVERSYGNFQRSFTLDSDVKPEKIEANFKDGILTVTVPKTTPTSTKKIPIKQV